MEIIRSEEIAKGINLTTITTNKFSTSCISINFLMPLKDNDGTFALLPRVLRRGNAEYKNIKMLETKLEDLYGAKIIPVTRKKGEVCAIGFIADVIDDKYADGQSLTEEISKLIGKLIYDPYLENAMFKEEYVESEKINLCNEIAASINDKRSYAVTRLFEVMCSKEAFGKKPLGTIEQVSSVTAKSLYNSYKNIIKNAKIQIFYCGSLDENRVKNIWLKTLDVKNRGQVELSTEVIRKAKEPKTITENMEISQGKLSIGFRTGITGEDKAYPALMMFNALFGSGTSSKLFVNVREKMSLCYYASSIVDKTKGILAVSSGIDQSKFEIAKDAILKQIEEIKLGNITDEEFYAAQKTLCGDFKGAKDSPLALESFYLVQNAGGFEYDVDYMIENVSKVTKEDVIGVAKKLSLDTIYFLKGGNK